MLEAGCAMLRVQEAQVQGHLKVKLQVKVQELLQELVQELVKKAQLQEL